MTACRRSRACYLAGCRNEPCRAANYRYMKRLQYDHAHGQKRRTDATPTRVWIDRLTAHGWTRTQIADAAGTTPTTIRRITVGESRNINRSIAAGVLSIPLGRPDQGRIDSTGTTRRLRALAVLGYPIYVIAEASRMDTSMLQGHLAAQHATISAPIARRIASTYRRLSLTPGPSQISRTRAAARGWHGPAAWEDIDDPACEPEAPTVETELPTGRRSTIDADLVMQLTAAGLSKQQIAWELGCTVRSVERVHDRRLVPAPAPAAIPAACGA
ncbi:hypothetical protein ACP4TB_30405 [Streptomyces sp. DR3-1]|uniref:hypothetical protein n=1 Tax=Streptomyces sp. DR3-1 TaxID=2951169 RepID=UPI0020449550|nr:hypothetical protein [Streptomyces sp. DR3-1]MCM3822585.1 hypothetical protein [Streptomyces sp. DR3-1]